MNGPVGFEGVQDLVGLTLDDRVGGASGGRHEAGQNDEGETREGLHGDLHSWVNATVTMAPPKGAVHPTLREEEGRQGGQPGKKGQEAPAAQAPATAPQGRAKKSTPHGSPHDGQRGNGYLRGGLAPALRLLLLELLLELEPLDLHALLPLHVLPGPDHLHLLRAGDEGEAGFAKVAENIHLPGGTLRGAEQLGQWSSFASMGTMLAPGKGEGKAEDVRD